MTRTLDPAQLDLLREIGNIGSGNAATSLSKLVNRRVDIHVPTAALLPLSAVSGTLGGPEVTVAAVMQAIEGDLNGFMFCLFEESAALRVAGLLMGTEALTLGDMEISALSEIANILTGTYLTALAKMTGFRLDASVPSNACDMVESLLDGSLAAAASTSDEVFVVLNDMVVGTETVRMHQMFVPQSDDLGTLLRAFGMAA